MDESSVPQTHINRYVIEDQSVVCNYTNTFIMDEMKKGIVSSTGNVFIDIFLNKRPYSRCVAIWWSHSASTSIVYWAGTLARALRVSVPKISMPWMGRVDSTRT